MWQDVLLSAVGVVFFAALLPSVAARRPPAFSTCLVTATGLAAVSVCYFTLGLVFAGVVTLGSLWAWTVLGILAWGR